MRKILPMLALLLVGWVAVQAQAGPDSLAGYSMPYMDVNQDGINDYYQDFTANNPVILSRDSTTCMQYKYQFGLGYGYGFRDRDGNGVNDVIDSLPNIGTINPTIRATRLDGIGLIKRGKSRHNVVTRPQLPDQLEAEHAIHDGHCKSDTTFETYRKRVGF